MSKATTTPEALIQQQRRACAKGMGAAGQILKGSLIERLTVCCRPGCRCLKGHKHGPYLYVSVFDGKQSRQFYVPQPMQAQVRRWVQNYRRLSASVERLSQLSLQLIRLRQRKHAARRGERQGKR